ncbi:hypothetical protein [Streptomyces massasporeus]|uniref:hypothetical protein n=1 Tax=Streptomyces massasporeus TaxID=67324 RepID=UPI0036C19328
MTHDYSLLLFDEMHKRFGRRAGWPPSASLVSPFFRIIFETLGPEEAGAFFEKARQAHRREHEVADAGTYQFGFAQYLEFDDSWHGSLPHLAAWEAMKAAHEITRADTPDFEQYIDTAVNVCAELSATGHRLALAAPAS